MSASESASGSAPEGQSRSRPGPESLAGFAARSGLELLRFAYLVSGDRQRAEDLLQEALLGMYRRFGDELPLDNPVGYARRAIAHANVSWARRAANREIPIAAPPDSAALGDDDPAERDELWRALRRLPVRQRTVLVMRFYLDSPDDAIADALGCRRASVRSLAARGLSALRSDPSFAEGGAR